MRHKQIKRTNGTCFRMSPYWKNKIELLKIFQLTTKVSKTTHKKFKLNNMILIIIR